MWIQTSSELNILQHLLYSRDEGYWDTQEVQRQLNETIGHLLHSQEPTNGSYSEPPEFSMTCITLFIYDSL
jgi:hypothetical protein